jgi:hypothetical protein
MPTEIWDKIFDIKYSLEAEEHNDYHKTLLDEFKTESNIVDELRHRNLYGYDSSSFIAEFFHYWAGEYFTIINNKKITPEYYLNHLDRYGRFNDYDEFAYDDLSITDDDSDDDYLYD